MKGDPKVIEYLNKGAAARADRGQPILAALSAARGLGLHKLAKKWRKESIEEMQHADKLVDRIIFLDGFPNMQVLDPLQIGQNVKEILECDLKAEYEARALYQEAATYCHGARITSRASCSRS